MMVITYILTDFVDNKQQTYERLATKQTAKKRRMSNDNYSTNPIYNRTGILILCSK